MSDALTTQRVQIPFPRDILRFLKEHEDKIAHGVVRTFARGYATWLYECAEEDTAILPGGVSALKRWKTDEGGEYGYRPSEVAFHLEKLNELFYAIMAYAYLGNTGQVSKGEKVLSQDIHLSEEVLSGFSCCLGFYVLDCYFATDAPEADKKWFSGLCHLTGEMRNMDMWRPHRDTIEQSGYIRQLLGTAVASNEPYYCTATPGNIRDPRIYKGPNEPLNSDPGYSNHHSYNNQYYKDGYRNGYIAAYSTGHQKGYMQCVQETNILFSNVGIMIEAERKRLVAFVKSLRHTLSVLETNPDVLEDGTWGAKTAEKGTNVHSVNGHGENV